MSGPKGGDISSPDVGNAAHITCSRLLYGNDLSLSLTKPYQPQDAIHN